MFFKNKKKIKQQKPFDVEVWQQFVRYTNIQKFSHGDKNHEFAQNKVFVHYKYLDKEYDHMLFRIKKENDIPKYITFWLPETAENKWMDCRMINRCSSAVDAIRYIADTVIV